MGDDVIQCPVDGCSFVIAVPEKRSIVENTDLYPKFTDHIVEHHVIRQLIGVLWRKALREARLG